MRAALVASCLRGALPPVDLRAVCFVRAIVVVCLGCDDEGNGFAFLNSPPRKNQRTRGDVRVL